MLAAVVTDFSHAPRYETVPDPVAGPHEEVVDVLASALHPRIRSQADGTHYTSGTELPLVPGIDGVGRRADGSLVYFILPDTTLGALAERTVVDTRRVVPLPADVDPVLVAAAMNPGMSSWVALRARIAFEPGQSVLVLGATGSAGQMAVQVARHLGASTIVAAARDSARLESLRAAIPGLVTIDLGAAPEAVAAEFRSKASEVDVVLDYLWGAPAQNALLPLVLGRSDRSRALDWIQIGSVAGADLTLPSAVLRQANIRFLGSGQGSASAAGILGVLPDLAREIDAGTFALDIVTRPLADVETTWGESTRARVVFTP